MFHRLNHRLGHYLLLLAAGAALTLPNLGAPSLWDIDEGHNAEAAREMLDSGNWLVPTFNYQLRDHKPPLLYWLQIAAYKWFGVNEFAARLPSALAALAAVLLTYELGRRMFGRAVGLLAGLILASAGMFCAAAHFANPDSLLNALTLATFFIFWRSMERSAGWAPSGGMLSRFRQHAEDSPRPTAGRESMAPQKLDRDGKHSRAWFIPAAILMGLAVLTKGPVGFLLPAAVIGLFLLWSGRLSLLLDYRLLLGVLTFILVALPWYAWISAETKGEFTRGFFLTHNFSRFLNPMENHRGPIYYYLVALLLGFVPWSPFLILAGIYQVLPKWKSKVEDRALRADRKKHWDVRSSILDPQSSIIDSPSSPRPFAPSPLRFLACWIFVYFVFFSLAGTKLPNYILPVYPAVAILTGRFLEEWRRGSLGVPDWAIQAGLVGIALVGLGAGLGLLLAGGVYDLRFLRGRQMPGLEVWSWVGLVPIAGALLAGGLWRRGHRTGMVISLAVAAVFFVGTLAAWGSLGVDEFKAPRSLVHEAGARQTDRDIRIGCFQYYQPSLVFYCRREVHVLKDEEQVLEFLQYPLPVYLFVSAEAWESLHEKLRGPHGLLAHHWDMYKGTDVVVITNKGYHSPGQISRLIR
jgi:4-amino-4-deoxy-L-arabinose transferase-like glycosyltransferase